MTNQEIDALIAEHVFGCEVAEDSYNPGTYAQWNPVPGVPGAHYERPDRVPSYSEDITAAMEVHKQMAELGYCCFKLYADYDYQWWATFKHANNHDVEFEGQGDTAAEAICRAALKAKRISL